MDRIISYKTLYDLGIIQLFIRVIKSWKTLVRLYNFFDISHFIDIKISYGTNLSLLLFVVKLLALDFLLASWFIV